MYMGFRAFQLFSSLLPGSHNSGVNLVPVGEQLFTAHRKPNLRSWMDGTNDISKRQVIQTPTHVGDLMVESASNDGDYTQAGKPTPLQPAQSCSSPVKPLLSIQLPLRLLVLRRSLVALISGVASIVLLIFFTPVPEVVHSVAVWCTLGAPGIRWDLVQQLGDMLSWI
ncbi:hypothetical protein B0H13DRAFT_2279174 [Mycena leptocephala]|nr:hypothetical protein B0H13DRAFT_2279174 [Mycena leptocephala]